MHYKTINNEKNIYHSFKQYQKYENPYRTYKLVPIIILNMKK